MATYVIHPETATGSDRQESIVWTLNGTPGHNSNVFEVTDNENDDEWDVGDAVTLKLHRLTGGVLELQGTYLGTVTLDGVVFPVVDDGFGGQFALGAGDYLSHAASDLTTILDTSGGSFTVCFFPGTLIATPSGERRIEDLVPGDQILIVQPNDVPSTSGDSIHGNSGCSRAALVKWLGRQTVSTRFGPAKRLMPVRFAAGSLGGGLPHSDLTVTADHAMLIDGILCQAGALANGTTITRVPLSELGDSYTVYHVETETHEIVLANGAPAETFVDNVSRRAFDNFAEFEKLYGDQPEMKELSNPRASISRHLPSRIRKRLGIDARRVAVA